MLDMQYLGDNFVVEVCEADWRKMIHLRRVIHFGNHSNIGVIGNFGNFYNSFKKKINTGIF